ncbi:MAG: Lrp/AsnC family transcriptional regulator [Cohaesibacter sp.]|jgi:DNA-binding Lrp family transcriptional regulator|nr:Lrp/AsnC family transcriptional regulator [Cohaesibacter sp.]
MVILFSIMRNSAMKLDETDRALLALLQEDARKPITLLAELAGLSRATTRKRLEALEAGGVITGYSVRVNPDILAGRFRAQVLLKLKTNVGESLVRDFSRFSQITQVVSISGRFDASLMVEAETSQEIDQVLDALRQHRDVEETESFLLLATKLDRRSL